jgi:hypothetical protein
VDEVPVHRTGTFHRPHPTQPRPSRPSIFVIGSPSNTVITLTVEPKQTVPLKVTIQNKVWSEERLIPLDKPQMGIAGLLTFESDGKQNWVTTEAPVTPTTFK